MNDKELIEKLKNHDSNAFEHFVKEYQQMVFSTCIGFVHSEDDANDLSQEVFIEVYNSIHKFREESKISTWLYRIATNKSLNFIRSQKKSKLFKRMDNFFTENGNHDLEISDSNEDQADHLLINADEKLLLKNALNSLKENQRIAFVLNKYEELSYKEIAEVMNISLSSVESLIHRAKKSLQTYILKKNKI